MEQANNKYELERFLEDLHFIYPNFNDTFYYASADSEQLNADGLEDWDLGDDFSLADWWRRFGWDGLCALAAKQRDKEPIKEIAERPKYKEARNELEKIAIKD